MLIEHKYKGYNIVKTGTSKYPWNIYKDDDHGFGTWVGYNSTLKGCKLDIDDGCFEDDNELNEQYMVEMSTINPEYCKAHTLRAEVEEQNEGPVPHIHVYHSKERRPSNCSYIDLTKAAYAKHHDNYGKKLTRKIKEQFIEVMTLSYPNVMIKDNKGQAREITGYQYAVIVWCNAFENGKMDKFTLDEDGMPIMPNYEIL